ncbi:MAG TPA: L,D-transpeptidase, partial [Solirubrobacteraceae bacterium]|nr:L,D-transpeptidase [Solirubrobacteraceae bacterium]
EPAPPPAPEPPLVPAPEPVPPAVPEPERPARPVVEDLHEPGVRSHFAFVNRRERARVRPNPRARALTRLRLTTEDGTDELVAVLARRRDARGRPWLRIRLPIRPNNTTGWVPESALGPLHPVRTWLRIDTKRFRISLVRNRRVVFRARVGVGEPQWPTPAGEYYIRSRLSGYGSAGSFYGPIAFGTNAHSDQLTDWPAGGIVGIHGTSLPHLIPGRISHGCVRLRNPDILRLDRLMPVGTPVTVR